MTERIEKLLYLLNSREYRSNRRHIDDAVLRDIEKENDSIKELKEVISREEPFLFENDYIGFNRTTDMRRSSPMEGNVTPNYYRIIANGFDVISSQIRDSINSTDDQDKINFGNSMLAAIDTICEMAEKYRIYAKEKGIEQLYQALCNIPHKGAENFYEALVFMKLSIFFMRCSFNSHITLGRFDQYMYPFYQKSKNNGVTDDEIFEMIEEFFISINFDTDLYHGVQQGDNGQSMVLGGFDRYGNSMYNELSDMCMKASLELKLIDPKINLRVGKNTPDAIFEFATELTKAGLGFPQYCNDDIVVPGLVKLGYAYEDALDYTVAACWEFIIPNCGADVPNISALDSPGTINRAIKEKLLCCNSFDELMNYTECYIAAECERIIKSYQGLSNPDQPVLSIYFDGCIESLTDLFKGGTKYHNFGCHGAGIANAADALAAVKKNVFDEKSISKEELLDALNSDFEGYSELRNTLRNSPKMGNNDDYVDDIASSITTYFAKHLNKKDNGCGGIWRAGTGSAVVYVTMALGCPATADGRKSGEPYSSSYSPSLDVKTTGLLSVIQSFTKYDFTDIINGGPLTIEIHDSVFKNDVGIKKTAMLVKEYIKLGGHQLQINAVNRDILSDAQKHPEKYPNLIVRVWGWSGYFNELDIQYQNHIIRRLEYTY